MKKKEAEELLNKWCNSLPVKERFQKFSELSEEDRLIMLLPEGNRLPPGYYPSSWNTDMDNAVQAAHNFVNERLVPMQQPPSNKRRRVEYNSDQSDNYDSDGYSSHGEVGMDLDNEADDHHNFADKLRYCVPLMAGFHLDELRGDTKWCYCPCSGKLSNWSKLCDLQGYFEDIEFCNSKKKMTPDALLQHVARGGKIHKLIHHFLEFLYRNFNGKGIRHIAFEKKDSVKYKNTKNVM